MKSILEKALVHLLNEETEKAQELMHQFVVERAKEIHESLRESDEEEIEALEEEFFTEADLEDAEAADNLEDDLDDGSVADEDLGAEGDMGDMDMEGAEAAEGDVEGDMGMDMEGEAEVEGEGDMADKIDAIEDEIAALQQEFDKIMSEFGDDEAEMDSEEDMGAEEDMAVAEVEDEEEFDDITESMVDDLKAVSTPNEDGKGANGEKLGHPEIDSPIAKDAKTRVLASKNTVGHKGWERETPPSKKDGPDRGRKYTNIRSKGTDGNASVAAAGPKGAELGKPVAGNTKSVIPGSKKGK